MKQSVDWTISRRDLEGAKGFLAAFPENVLILDAQKFIIWANRLVLLHSPNAVGLHCSDLLPDSCFERGSDQSEQEPFITHFKRELHMSHKANKEAIFENWIIPIQEDMGEAKEFIFINRSIPDYYENEIHKSSAQIPEKVESAKITNAPMGMTKFFHDMRNPLNGLFGAIQLMNDTEFPSAHKELFHMLKVSYEGMLDLLEKGEQKSLGLEATSRYLPEDFSIRKMTLAVIEPFKNKASRREILLRHITPAVENDLIRTDRYRLTQMLSLWTEIFVNCIYRGTVEIQVQAMEKQRRQGIKVVFTGDGIIQKSLFESGHIHMSGISLTAEQYEMYSHLQNILNIRELQVQNDEKRLIYSFWLPVVILKLTPDQKPIVEKRAEQQSKLQGKKKDTLMIVEDDFLSRMTYQLSLSKQYDLVFAKTGLECLALYAKQKPDLILLDIMLPDINGFEVFERIEELDKLHPPVIACTARVIDTEASYLKSFGFNDYLPKPIQNKDLKAMLDAYLRLNL